MYCLTLIIIYVTFTFPTQEPMEVYAATRVQLLLEDLLQLVQSEAAHRQRPRPEPGRLLQRLQQG